MSTFENDILSKVELVLPRNVVETCYLLPTGTGTEFLSSNIPKATVTRTFVSKLEDESVRIQVTVSLMRPVSGHNPEYVMITDMRNKDDRSQELAYQNTLTLVPVNVDTVSSSNKKSPGILSGSQSSPVHPSATVLTDIIPELTNNVQPMQIINSNTSHIFDGQILQKEFCQDLPAGETVSSVDGVVESGFNVANDVYTTTTEVSDHLLNDPHEHERVREALDQTNIEESDHAKENEVPMTSASEISAGEIIPKSDSNADNVVMAQVYNEDTAEQSSHIIIVKRINFEKCLMCGLEVRDLEALREHLLSSHDCEILGKEYISMVNKKLKVKCQVCHEEFPSPKLLNKHVPVHLQDKEAQCEQCGEIFDSVEKCEKHNDQVHLQSERFLCHLCPSSFKTHSYLASHLKHVHSPKKETFKCDQCGKSFSTEKYLYNHNLRVHGHKKYTCTYCDKGFTNAANRDRHVVLVHERSKIKGHSCPFCIRFFALKFNMMDHIKTVHRQEFSHSCDLCGAGFRRQSEVITHQKAIHGDSKVKFTSPVKRKPGRPNRSGSKTLATAVTNVSRTRIEPKDSGKKVFLKPDKQIVANTDKDNFIQASPEMVRTLGLAPLPTS